MKKSVVSIARGTNPAEMLREVLEPLGGIENLVRPNSTVVLKPNAGHHGTPDSSVNTNPELVAAVIREVRKAKPKEIIVAESAAIGCDTMECLEISGILKAAQEAGADKIIDIKSDKDLISIPIRDAQSALTRTSLPRFLIEADHLINLPILKSHCSMVFTAALKNIKGVVQDKVHWQMHQTNLAAAMMDVWSIVKADLSIVDMIRPAEGFGPHTALPVDFGCLVAGRDPVAIDATICRMIGISIDSIAYFEAARKRGIGNYAEELITVKGQQIQDVYKPLWLPYLDGLKKYKEYNIDSEGACSSCLSLMGLTMENLKALGEYDKNKDVTILVGRKKSIPEGIDPDKLILVGDCLKKYRKKGLWSGGCPPGEPFPAWTIIDRKGWNDITPDTRDRMAKQQAIFQKHMLKLKKEWEETKAKKPLKEEE